MMKKLHILFIVLAVLCLSTAVCSAADQWEDVKSAGVIRFGVSPDYYPFVYTEGTDLDGLDVALMKEMGQRLGLSVQPINMAFDGLVDALLIGQVDVVGGGFSITEERLKQIDYTNPYYQAGGSVICRADNVVNEDTIRTAKIGVLKGSSFEQWVASNLLMGGKVSPVNVYTFSKNSDTIRSLKNGEVDLVIIDDDFYRAQFKNDSSIVVVSTDIVNEKYAFGLPKDSTLIPQLNNVLREMFLDGTAQKIADTYFAKDFSDLIEPSITRPAQVTDDMIVRSEDIVAPRDLPEVEVRADNPANCRNGMLFVSDVSLPDGTTLLPNMSATKTWNVKNTGTCTWDSSYSFSYVKGSLLGVASVSITKLVAPGENYEISVPFVTPAANGEYTAWWQMRSPEGTGFGQTIWYDIKVDGTYGSSDQKVSQGTPKIFKWYPDFYSTDSGKCPRTYYEVLDAYQVEFYINNQFVDSSRNLSGYTYLCPPKKPGTYTIAIVAVGENRTSTAYSFIDMTQYPDPGVGVSAEWPHWTLPEKYGMK
ncbi:MAG: transporter substrate-binding domain-containing protein [Anaerolineaceae bacterium]|nr:transporter substrate-binding domain-containing protein [Anaerolineaceae bacterium]